MSHKSLPKLVVNWMLPDLLSLYGDRGNLMALARLGDHLGWQVTINRVDDPADATPADLAVFSSGDLDLISVLATRRDDLLRCCDQAKQVVVIGTTVSLFATTTHRVGHPDVRGLGLIPAEIEEQAIDLTRIEHPYAEDLLLELPEDLQAGPPPYSLVAGVYVKSVKVTLDGAVQPFAKVLYGLDNTGTQRHSGWDGARHSNLLWTNLLGPAFVRNPWLALSIIAQATGTTIPVTDDLAQSWELEQQSLASVRNFIATKR